MAQSNKVINDSLTNVDVDCTNDVKQLQIPKKLLIASEQWSQEENSAAYDTHCDNLQMSKEHPGPSLTHNNNLIVEKSNLSCSHDKYCFYHKFPIKLNKNVYSEMLSSKKDGMEEYFEQNVSGVTIDTSHGLKESIDPEKDNYSLPGSENFQDKINALNGEDDDEDNGCIYTYKGDNYESNLSQLLDTCFSCGLPTSVRSAPPCGSVSIQRILNGSSRVKSNPKGNPYSPEMDFLEMDFDPSCGDGADSECEDNNILNIDVQSDTVAINDLESKLSDKCSNIKNITSLMCHRCEMCFYNEQKVNNISDSTINKSNKSELDTGINGISIKESHRDSKRDISNLDTDNYDCNTFRKSSNNVPSSFVNLSICKDKESYENNLDCVEEYAKFSDEGEDADDERDDSVSEHYDPNSCNDAKNSLNTLYSPKEENCHSNKLHSLNRHGSCSLCSVPNESNVNCTMENYNNSFAVVNVAADYEVKVCNKSHKINNNLGSISAPEVSPTKEYSCVDKFTRSFSFHNQLSSPKYENVCITNRHKENIPNCRSSHCPYLEGFSCSCSSVSHELEACANRLSQRVKSVFNVGSSMNKYPSPISNFKNIEMYNTNGVTVSMNNHFIPTVFSSLSTNDSDHLPKLVPPLPSKSIPEKIEDPNADPNTTSKECNDNVQEGLTNTIEKVMIWTEFQAAYRQVVQIDNSACGATAVINVLLALDQAGTVAEVSEAVKTRQRAENAPLVEYMFSRCNAGATHEDLLRGVDELSKGLIVSRFFHMYPKRSFQLSRWLSHWIKRGGVPVATLNLQVGVYPRQTVPDAWHHQMVFGVGPLGVYLTNPLECVSVTLLSEQLCSSSVLLVRRADVVSRWDNKDKLIKLSLHSDPRWNDMNVLGQLVGVLKEETSPEKFQGRRHLTSHVSIPAACQSGVSIFMRSDNPSVEELMSVPELPLLDEGVL